MFYYIQYDSNHEILVIGKSDRIFELPPNCEWVTEEEYEEAIQAIRDAEEAERQRREEERRRREEEEAERRRREREERQRHLEIILDYVERIQDGEITIDDVPEEYRDEVNDILNPPPEPEPVPTNEELDERTSALEDAMDFVLMNEADSETSDRLAALEDAMDFVLMNLEGGE